MAPDTRPGVETPARNNVVLLSSGTERVQRRAALGYSSRRPPRPDERARLQEDEPPIAVVVRQRSEGLVAERHLRVQPPRPHRRSKVQASGGSQRHSIDAAHPVDGHLFDQQVVDQQVIAVLRPAAPRRPVSLAAHRASRPPLEPGPSLPPGRRLPRWPGARIPCARPPGHTRWPAGGAPSGTATTTHRCRRA